MNVHACTKLGRVKEKVSKAAGRQNTRFKKERTVVKKTCLRVEMSARGCARTLS